MTAWFDVAFDDLYAELYSHRDDAEARTAIDWLGRTLPAVGLGELRSRRVLDLGCGAGRHLRAMAGKGVEAIGIDRSLALLRRARVGLPASAALVAGDLRALPFADRAFTGAISMFTSLGYFATESDHAAAFAEVGRTVQPGGFLLIDYLNAQAVIADPGRDTRRELGDYEVKEERRVAAAGTRIEKQVTIWRRPAADREPIKQYVESVALWSRAELESRVARAGFAVRSVTGSYAGGSFGPLASRLIVLCERRSAG